MSGACGALVKYMILIAYKVFAGKVEKKILKSMLEKSIFMQNGFI
jgi:hypothetical protein